MRDQIKDQKLSFRLFVLVVGLFCGNLALAQTYYPPSTATQSNIDTMPAPASQQTVGTMPAAPPRVQYSDGRSRLIPFFGAGSIGTDGFAFAESQSFGAWIDFGTSTFTFQTGLNFDTRIIRGVLADFHFDTWGIPLMVKWNISGQPQSTLYFKGGVNLIDENDEFFGGIDTLGVLGVGAAIPLGSKAAALVIEWDYSTLLTREEFASDLDEYKLYGALAFRM